MKRGRLSSILLLGFCLTLIPVIVEAATEEKHFQPPPYVYVNFEAVIGTISGLSSLNKGDEVAAFDSAGNNYSKGVVKDINGRYALSLFPAEKGGRPTGHHSGEVIDDVDIQGDFDIPGFEKGDEVTFKIYVKAEGAEFTLVPKDANAYKFSRHGYPPKTINLVYKAPDDDDDDDDDDGGGGGGGDDDDDDDGSGTTIPGALPYITPDETDTTTGPLPVVREKVVERESAPAVREEGARETDYYPQPARGTTPRRTLAGLPKKEKAKVPYAEPYRPDDKERKRIKLPEDYKASYKKGWPLWLKLLLLLLLLLLLYLAGRKLYKMQKEAEKEDQEAIEDQEDQEKQE